MKGMNCGFSCKHFHGYCETDCNGGLKFVEFCEKNNDKFLDFQRKYGKKSGAWVNENIIMSCFEPTENVESLNGLDESITNLLENYDS